MKRPTVGIIPLADVERDSLWMLPGYMEGILRAGGLPVMLPLTGDREVLAELACGLDGFLFTGGHDVSPALYGQPRLPACGACCPARDEMERALFSMLWELDKPVLGICRGLQSINVLLGGTLYQDLPTQAPSDVVHCQRPPYDRPSHTVRLAPGTPLHGLLRAGRIAVNSYHHQAVRALASPLQAMAYSPEGLVEAAWAPEKKYVWAVQWHPEFSFQKDENSRRIFGSFVDAMR